MKTRRYSARPSQQRSRQRASPNAAKGQGPFWALSSAREPNIGSGTMSRIRSPLYTIPALGRTRTRSSSARVSVVTILPEDAAASMRRDGDWAPNAAAEEIPPIIVR